MRDLSSEDITGILESWNLGSNDALSRLVPLLYRELHQIAHSYMASERAGHTLQTTALLNEAYLRLARLKKIQWQDRDHFLAIASRLMRRILVDSARTRRAEKRGGQRKQVSLNEGLLALPALNVDLVDLDRVLRKLSVIDQRKVRVIELRFFGGLKVEEAARVLGISVPTLMRDWNFARAWILSQLQKH